MTTKIFKKELAGILPGIFQSKTAFLRAFGGDLQVVEGKMTDKYLELKVSDTDVVINDYSTDPNVGMGEGTAKSSRFGEINEIISTDLQVEFDNPKSFNDGIDRVTVNDDFDDVAAERYALNAAGWASYYDRVLGAYLASQASQTLTGELSPEGVNEVFDEAYEAFVNSEVSDVVEWVAYVTPKVFNAIVNSSPASLEKGSSVDVDNKTLYKYKGFVLQTVPAGKMENDIYFTADNVGVAGLGLMTARVIPHPDFDGIVVQGAVKLGKYVPEKNKEAIIVADLTEPTPTEPTPEG